MDMDKIKYINFYNANSFLKFINEQIQEIIDYGISSEKLFLKINHVTEISEIIYFKKILPISKENSSSIP